MRKARGLSREFHSSVEQMMREVELHEVQNELKKATEFDLDREFNTILDPVNDPAAGCRSRGRSPTISRGHDPGAGRSGPDRPVARCR